jgi:hypothetical protein
MKNIHLLPTDKPSRLWINNLLQGKLELHKEVLIGNNTAQNIYITSNNHNDISDEGINHVARSWVLDTTRNKVYKTSVNIISGDDIQKIILTTDQSLDSVQAIDDEFLEWFVKNPSCEFVKTKLVHDYEEHPELVSNPKEEWSYYEIIIPKEEPEQSVEEYTQQGLEKYFEEPEQETLEEAIKQELENHFFSNISEIKQAEYFINFGAKWQQEQDKKMYSEEDLEVAYFSGIKTTGEGWNGEYANGNNPSIEEEFQEGFQEWLRQFKNK